MRARPKVAVLAERFGGAGGSERFSAEVTARIAASGRFEMHVYCWRRGPSAVDCSAITFHRVPRLKFPRFMRPLLFNAVAQRRIGRGGFDIVHAHQPTPRADVFSMHGAPHSHWMERVMGRRPQLIDRAMMRIDRQMIAGGGSSLFLPVSAFLRERFEECFAPLPGSWRVVPPGVDQAHFARSKGVREEVRAGLRIDGQAAAVLFVGMNFKTKGLRLLVDALAQVPAGTQAPPMHLLVVGRGDPAPYRAQAQRLGIAGRVHFAGQVADPARWYSAADIFALPSEFETYGMAVAEAMAAGLPVIVSDQMGSRDLVAGSGGGWVLAAPTAAQIAAHLRDLQDPHLRSRMGSAARTRAVTLTWERTASEVAAAYEEVLARRGRSRA